MNLEEYWADPSGGARRRKSRCAVLCAAQVDPRYAVGGSGFFISGRLRIGWFVQGELVNFQVGADPANAPTGHAASVPLRFWL